MYDYNASYLNEQATLLEEFHKIQKYLIENPLYQIYQSSADYVAGVNEYYINEVAVREGGTLSVGDVVLFSNVYYGVITEIDEETEMFTIAQGISFRGATGETGPRGGVGPRGLPGADGTNGTDGKNGLSIYLYDGALNDTLTTAYVAQINVPTGYTVKTGDILFSTLETSYGAMSLVTSDAVDFSTVVSIDYIGQLTGASGGKVIRDIDGSIPASALENISVSVGTASNGVTYIRASMKGEVTYDDNTYDTINYYIDLPIKAGDGVTIEAQPIAGSTGNKQLVISASGSGGGVSDVKINGTSIVSDGVANIPKAGDGTTGLVSTSEQIFSGKKGFSGGLYIYNKNEYPNTGTINIYKDSDRSLLISGNKTELGKGRLRYIHFYSAQKGAYPNQIVTIDITSAQLLGIDSIKGTSGQVAVLPSQTQTGYFVVQPSTWSTGTSGSVTLPSAGLYEVKVTKTFGEYDTDIVAFINFAKDGTKGAISTAMSFVGTSGLSTGFVVVDPTGVMTFFDTAFGEGDMSVTLSYRKIGIA